MKRKLEDDEGIKGQREKSFSKVEDRLVKDSPYYEQKKYYYAPIEKMRVVVVPNFPSLGKAAAFRFLEWVQQNPRGVCSLPTGKTPEHFIQWVPKILNEWDSPEIQQECQTYGLLRTEKPPVLNDLIFVQMDEFYPISPQQQNSFHYYVMEYYIKGFGLDPNKALLMDCSKIGLDNTTLIDSSPSFTNDSPTNRVGFGTTGEFEDHIFQERIEDVWPLDYNNGGGTKSCGVDLTLRIREPANWLERVQQCVLRKVDQWCAEYEEKIRSLGGIGFFLGGIGPDGHIAFNCQGCSHFSTTRLDQLNYKSQAAAASDLGGIDAVQKRKVVTIGLGTLTFNPDCVAIICAAGEAKARVVRDAVERSAHVDFPATCLHKLRNASFFLTTGAAKLLSQRELVRLQNLDGMNDAIVEKVLVKLSFRLRKRLVDLTMEDVAKCPSAAYVVQQAGDSLGNLAMQVRKRLILKIEKGCRIGEEHANKTFLHTEPHHDDIMLGYLPAVLRTTRSNEHHHFVCCTSGFNSVSNKHMLMLLDRVENFVKSPTWKRLCNEGYFDNNKTSSSDDESIQKCVDFRRRDVWKFLDGIAATDTELRDEGAARRLVANMCELYGDSACIEPASISKRVHLLRNYFQNQYAGQRDNDVKVQTLKGSCREFEAECVWGYIGWQTPDISHLRLGFYTSDIFAPEPTQQRDVMPLLTLMRNVKPNIVSVALDPEASGPDTHYKVLQAVTSALEQYSEDAPLMEKEKLLVWGYRNVWFRFESHEVNTIIPVSLQNISTLNHMFMNCFESQRNAEFPAFDIEGPFCAMSQKVQVKQYDIINTCLGYEWFHKHSSPLIRAARGLVFLQEMELSDLLNASNALRKHTENVH